MRCRQIKKWMGILLVLLLIAGSMTTTFKQFISFPKELRLLSGDGEQLELRLPTMATATVANPEILAVNGVHQSPVNLNLKKPFTLSSRKIGKTRLTLHLFGSLPLKTVDVRVLPDIRVVPGGQSIGVKINAAGVMVVGHHLVQSAKGTFSPGEQAGIRSGDYIIEMNGKKMRKVNQVAETVRRSGEQKKPIDVLISRRGKKHRTKLTPIWDENEETYRIGLYIRDSAAGVGTLTFYDPREKRYGALGHVITDVDTGKPIAVGDGKILPSNVTSIQKGASGEPGEKRAIFLQENQVLGSITRNTPFGIFGIMKEQPKEGLYDQTVPVALSEEVKEGPAEILTVVEGQKVQRFQIEITHVINQKYPATKGMVIRVTDPQLLKKTGGIVQGMSGSPILQNGKLIGAVTHVFVNDPTSGYGTFIEWMLQDAGVLDTTGLQQGPVAFSPIFTEKLVKNDLESRNICAYVEWNK